MRALAIALLWVGTTSASSYLPDGHPPPQEHPCDLGYDCPKAACWDAECLDHACQYTRKPIEECCLNDDDCCQFAGEFETGICSKNCTCRFIPTLQFQCTRDDHCDGLVSSLMCRDTSECHLPYCDHGFCECINATGIDLDGDGVSCPEDCDDTNPRVSKTVHCAPDLDNDNWPGCFNDTSAECHTFCVEPEHTCPWGWTDPTDDLRFLSPKSKYPSDKYGAECPIFDEEQTGPCDCCEEDNRAYPDSPYTSHQLNTCGNADYNCDGEITRFACCVEGHSMHVSHEPASSSTEFDGRQTWYYEQCEELTVPSEECGGCSTAEMEPVFMSGWACQDDCEDAAVKRSVSFGYDESECPTACEGQCSCLEDGGSTPEAGECAKRVTGCTDVGGGLYSDATDCCIVTTL